MKAKPRRGRPPGTKNRTTLGAVLKTKKKKKSVGKGHRVISRDVVFELDARSRHGIDISYSNDGVTWINGETHMINDLFSRYAKFNIVSISEL